MDCANADVVEDREGSRDSLDSLGTADRRAVAGIEDSHRASWHTGHLPAQGVRADPLDSVDLVPVGSFQEMGNLERQECYGRVKMGIQVTQRGSGGSRIGLAGSMAPMSPSAGL